MVDRQGQFWDGVTDSAARDFAKAAILAEARRLIESLVPANTIQGCDVLDAGCGAGDYSAAFLELGARRVSAFDVSAGSLQLARPKVGTLAGLAQASLSELPYRANSFDVIWSWGVLHYVPDSTAALREVGRVLRPGGLIVIHTLRRGLWSSLELGSAAILSRAPGWVQSLVLATGERTIPPLARLMTGKRPEAFTAKSIRQKLHERLFVPGRLATFTLEQIQQGLGERFEAREEHPPVSDLLRRDMSMTIVARKSANY